MKQCRWQLLAIPLAVIGVVAPRAAHAQFTGPPAVPKTFGNDILPGPGRGMSTVDNFSGLVAGALIQGTGKDNAGNTLEFEVDVRVMQGIYIGLDGSTYRGTFSFTWLDLFAGSGPTRHQIHELHMPHHSPPFVTSTDPDYGPFWTGFIPEASVKGSPYTALMTLDYTDAPQHEAFQELTVPEVSAKATVHLEWSPGFQSLYPYFDPLVSYSYRNTVAGFSGVYTPAGAKIDFSFTSQVSRTDKTPFTFTSNPDGQRVLYAQVGQEVTGSYVH